MKRFSVYALALCLSVGVWGSRPRHVAQGLDWHEDSASGIAYWCDDKTGEAEVADWYDEEEEVYEYYSQTALFVPAEFVLNYGGASMGGEGGGSAKTYKVTALGTYAFRKAAASKLEFETPSNLRTVKAFAQYLYCIVLIGNGCRQRGREASTLRTRTGDSALINSRSVHAQLCCRAAAIDR